MILDESAGEDGGAPGDLFLTDPTRCRLTPYDMVCGDDQNGACFAPQQARAINDIYAGTRNPRTAKLIYPQEMLGTENFFAPLFEAPPLDARRNSADLARWVFGPEWNAGTFDLDEDMGFLNRSLPSSALKAQYRQNHWRRCSVPRRHRNQSGNLLTTGTEMRRPEPCFQLLYR